MILKNILNLNETASNLIFPITTKKSNRALILIIVLIIAFAKGEAKVPSLMVIADGLEVEAINCGYELISKELWFQRMTVIADCSGFDEAAKRLEGIKASPNAVLDFSFDKTKDQLVILDWHQEVELNTKDMFVAPQEVGTYV